MDATSFKTTQELKEELVTLKLQLAFQEIEDREIGQMLAEAEKDAELDAFINQSTPLILYQIKRTLRRQETRHILTHALMRTSKIVAILLLVLLIGFSTAMAMVPSLRATVLRFIINITDTHTELSLEDSTYIDVPVEWCGNYYPSYIPEGYSLTQVVPYPCEAYYENVDGTQLSFYEYDDSSYTSIDTEDAEIRSIPLHETTALVSEKEGNAFVVWSSGSRYFIVNISQWSSSTLDMAESTENVVKVAESVCLIE